MNTYAGRDCIVAAVKPQYADRVPATVMFGAYDAKLAGFTMAVEECIDSAAKEVSTFCVPGARSR